MDKDEFILPMHRNLGIQKCGFIPAISISRKLDGFTQVGIDLFILPPLPIKLWA